MLMLGNEYFIHIKLTLTLLSKVEMEKALQVKKGEALQLMEIVTESKLEVEERLEAE
jgi:hypothetical protein